MEAWSDRPEGVLTLTAACASNMKPRTDDKTPVHRTPAGAASVRMMLRLLSRVTHPLRLERERALCGESCTSARPRGLLRAAGLLRACSKEEGGIHIDGSGISAACFTASAKMCRLTRLRSARTVAMHESVLAR